MQKKTYSLTLLSQTVLGRCKLMCRSEAEEAPGVTRTSSAQKANEKWASSRVQKHYPDAGIKEDGGGGAHPGGGVSKEQEVTVASFFIDIHRFLSQGSIKMSPLGPRILGLFSEREREMSYQVVATQSASCKSALVVHSHHRMPACMFTTPASGGGRRSIMIDSSI